MCLNGHVIVCSRSLKIGVKLKKKGNQMVLR